MLEAGRARQEQSMCAALVPDGGRGGKREEGSKQASKQEQSRRREGREGGRGKQASKQEAPTGNILPPGFRKWSLA